jgi:hypothetical protein
VVEVRSCQVVIERVSDDPDDSFVVLADPKGNEFCIVRDAG